jgi:hypothetical protein
MPGSAPASSASGPSFVHHRYKAVNYNKRLEENQAIAKEILIDSFFSGVPFNGIQYGALAIPPLHESIEAFLKFYFDEVSPFITKLQEHSSQDQIKHYSGISQSHYHITFTFRTVLAVYLQRGSYSVHRRYEVGLLRMQHIELLKVVLKTLMLDSKAIIRNVEELDENARSQLNLRAVVWELSLAGIRARKLASFFASGQFRSERLELLLMKYLEEDGVNMEIVKRLDEVDRLMCERRFEEARRRILAWAHVGDNPYK